MIEKRKVWKEGSEYCFLLGLWPETINRIVYIFILLIIYSGFRSPKLRAFCRLQLTQKLFQRVEKLKHFESLDSLFWKHNDKNARVWIRKLKWNPSSLSKDVHFHSLHKP